MSMDLANCLFYLTAAALTLLTIRKGRVQVHWSLPSFYGLWCLYGAANFARLGQWWSVAGVSVMAVADALWLRASVGRRGKWYGEKGY